MSILIKGMEMPKNCKECGLYIEGACYAKGYRDYRSIMDTAKPDDCPLIELPPHGRLIDIKSVEDRKFVTVSNDYQRWWNGALDPDTHISDVIVQMEFGTTYNSYTLKGSEKSQSRLA